MPFRHIDIRVAFGTPELLVKAGEGDAELLMSCTTYGATGVSGGPNYIVGSRQDDGSVAGIFVTSNEFSTDLAEGDELWVAAAEDLPFASAIHITGLIRSVPSGDSAGEGDGDEPGRRNPRHARGAAERGGEPQDSHDQREDDQQVADQ